MHTEQNHKLEVYAAAAHVFLVWLLVWLLVGLLVWHLLATREWGLQAQQRVLVLEPVLVLTRVLV